MTDRRSDRVKQEAAMLKELLARAAVVVLGILAVVVLSLGGCGW